MDQSVYVPKYNNWMITNITDVFSLLKGLLKGSSVLTNIIKISS